MNETMNRKLDSVFACWIWVAFAVAILGGTGAL
jgi:hypothetical protein